MTNGIPTGCDALDALLGNGLPCGTITQLYGPPASGKTNIALSAAVTVAAAGNKALFIDTEGLSLDRFHQLTSQYDDETVSSRINIREAHDFDEQRAAVHEASEIAPDADLIVLDSATGFYRLERTDEDSKALRDVARQLTILLSLARRHDLAVLATNQVYTDPDTDRIRPLGGYTVAHWTGVVIRLERFRGGNRRATIEKHQSQPAGESAQFQITQTGIAAQNQPAP